MGNSSEVRVVSGQGMPLVGNDIDTDRIIPARFLRAVTFDGLGDQVFADDRKQIEDHPFNQPQYKDAKVLVVNRNFGCGSSREHAPQAIARWGIEAIVGESFAEIFFGNCVAIGIPCVTISAEGAETLQTHIKKNPEASLRVDLDGMTVISGDLTLPIEMSEGARQMFLNGTWDACGQLMTQADAIAKTAESLPYVSWAA